MGDVVFQVLIVLVPVTLAALFYRQRRRELHATRNWPATCRALNCPYCPRASRTQDLRTPVGWILHRGDYAWCGRCGALYRDSPGTWDRPNPDLLEPRYRDPGRELEGGP